MKWSSCDMRMSQERLMLHFDWCAFFCGKQIISSSKQTFFPWYFPFHENFMGATNLKSQTLKIKR